MDIQYCTGSTLPMKRIFNNLRKGKEGVFLYIICNLCKNKVFLEEREREREREKERERKRERERERERETE